MLCFNRLFQSLLEYRRREVARFLTGRVEVRDVPGQHAVTGFREIHDLLQHRDGGRLKHR